MNRIVLAQLLFFAFIVTTSAQDGTYLVSSIQPDSVTTIPSLQYQSRSFLHKAFMGSNYRKAWQQPVKLPVFYLSASGFTIKELGGGAQTKSLRMVDSVGKEWSLRTVEKDVSGAMPFYVKNTAAQNAVQDLISAAFPYAAMLAGELAQAASINAAKPKTYFVADDTAFGEVRHLFAEQVCTLEERDPGFDSTCTTDTVLANVKQSSVYRVQQKVFLKARLFDMLIGDWDRHEGNWQWGLKDSAGFKFYYAIPRDRDWAFYQSSGWLPLLARQTGTMRNLVSFDATPKNFKNLNSKAENLDRQFLNELTAADWNTAIAELQTSLTDEAIENAVRKLPTAIFNLYGASFIEKLKSRRNKLKKETMNYYRFLIEK